MNSSNEDNRVAAATEIGKEYFIENYQTEVEFTSHKFGPEDLGPEVGLNGHVKDNPEQEVFILINYETNEVVTAGVPDELRPLKTK